MFPNPFRSTARAVPLLAILLAACSTPPPDLDLSRRHPSVQGRFMVEIEPPTPGPALNQIHAWTVKLSTPEGGPVTPARIAVRGGMPQHGHGLPTQPRVTRELAPGRYLLEGVKFSMSGWWELRLDIEAGGARDVAVFNLSVGDAGLQP